jgi:hypothetical protein
VKDVLSALVYVNWAIVGHLDRQTVHTSVPGCGAPSARKAFKAFETSGSERGLARIGDHACDIHNLAAIVEENRAINARRCAQDPALRRVANDPASQGGTGHRSFGFRSRLVGGHGEQLGCEGLDLALDGGGIDVGIGVRGGSPCPRRRRCGGVRYGDKRRWRCRISSSPWRRWRVLETSFGWGWK